MAEHRTIGTPEWVRAAVRTGVPFGIAMGIVEVLQNHSWWRAVIMGVVAGVVFGAVMGRWVIRQQRAAVATTGVPGDRWTAAQLRAGARRPAAASPELRADLRRLLTRRLSESRRVRRRTLLVFGVFGLASVLMAVFDSPWWWLALPFWASLYVVGLTEPARLQRKIAALGPPSA